MMGLLIVLCIFCYTVVFIILGESEDSLTILFWPIVLPFRWYMKTDNSWWIRECVEILKGQKR